MRKLLLCVAVAGLLGAALVGCGSGDSGGSEEYGEKPVVEMHPDTKKYDMMQYECPVCGGKALKEEFYSDVDDQGRIYFDKKECKEKFDQNPQEYLKDYTNIEKQMGRGAGGR